MKLLEIKAESFLSSMQLRISIFIANVQTRSPGRGETVEKTYHRLQSNTLRVLAPRCPNPVRSELQLLLLCQPCTVAPFPSCPRVQGGTRKRPTHLQNRSTCPCTSKPPFHTPARSPDSDPCVTAASSRCHAVAETRPSTQAAAQRLGLCLASLES